MRAGRTIVGRVPELRLVADTLASPPRFLLICGEAGIGKTSLLDEAGAVAREKGLRVLKGVCTAGCEGMPLLPLLAPLAEALGRASQDPLQDLLDRHPGELSERTDVGVSARRLLSTIHSILVDQPTLLILDDIQWADVSTLVALDFVSRRTTADPLVLILAARDEPGSLDRIPFADGRLFARVDLARLTLDDVAAQAQDITGGMLSPEMLDQLFVRSAGNPLFVSHLLAAGLSDELPSTLRAVLGRRLAAMSMQTRRVLGALAALGGAADEELLATVADLDLGATEGSLAEAAAAGVVVSGSLGFEFQHPLLREITTRATPVAASRRLHAAAAGCLQAAGANPAALARHWLAAGNEPAAFRSSLAAGEAAAHAFAFPEAGEHLRTALDRWQDDAPTSRWEVRAQAAKYTWLAGDAASALALIREAITERSGDTQELALAQGEYAWDANDVPAAIAAFERAAALVDDTVSDELRAFAYFGLARALVPQRRFDESCVAGVEALRHARAARSPRAERNAQGVLGIGKVNSGDVQGGLAQLREAMRSTGVQADNIAAFLAATLALCGRLEEALSSAEEALAICEGLGVADTYGADLRGRAALCLVELGRWDEAEKMLTAAAPRGLPCLARGLLHLRRGRLVEAAAALDEVTPAGAPAAGWPGALAAGLALARAELALLRGEPKTASARLEQIEIGSPPTPWDRTVAAERRVLSLRCPEDRPVLADDARSPFDLPDEVLARGLHAEATGDWAEALRAWESPLRPYRHTHACLRQSAFLFGSGDRDRDRDRDLAKRALQQGAAAAVELGAAPLVALADDIARRARVQAIPTRRPDASPFEPTRRELDVLALVSDGLTNRQIAERLFLSPKTVGIHVSRLLRKLGAHTRGEAVAIARRRGLLS